MDIRFEFRGTNRVANALRKLASQMPEVVDKAMGPWAQETRAALKSTPYPAKNTQKMRWVSEKQRKFVMAAIRDGRIKVPYRRTGNLANRWRASRQRPGVWAIENSAPYAVYVISDNQYWMHKGRWYMASKEIQRYLPKLPKRVGAELAKVWAQG